MIVLGRLRVQALGEIDGRQIVNQMVDCIKRPQRLDNSIKDRMDEIKIWRLKCE